MEKEQFLTTLRDELIQRGLAPELAQRHVRSIALTLTPEDTAEIQSIQDPDEIAVLAEGIMKVKNRSALRKTENLPDEKSAPTAVSAVTEAEPAADGEEYSDDDVKIATGHGPARPIRAQHEEPAADDSMYEDLIQDDDTVEIEQSGRGRTIFWVVAICTLPISLALLAAYFGLFGLVFAALCAVIVLLVAGLIGGVAVGAAVSLIGIIYGITQLITVTSAAPGLYEIGLGLSVGGLVMLGGILVYNCAIRLIPWLIRLLGMLFGFCTGKLKDLLKMAKEACYKL